MIVDILYRGAHVVAKYHESGDIADFDIESVSVADPVEACTELGTCNPADVDRVVRERRHQGALILEASQEWKRRHEYAGEPAGHP